LGLNGCSAIHHKAYLSQPKHLINISIE